MYFTRQKSLQASICSLPAMFSCVGFTAKGYLRIDRFCRLQPSSWPNLRARNVLQDEMTESEHQTCRPSKTVNIGVCLCFSVREAVPIDLGVLPLHWFVCNASM
jgi:hypothetical protein